MKHLRNFAWGDRVNCINEPAVVDPSQVLLITKELELLNLAKEWVCINEPAVVE
jgi:hypothetical protein